MAFRVVIENNARIQQTFRVEQVFDGFHHLIGCISPFVAYKRSHVSARTVFCFQRAVVFVRNQCLDIIHQVFVAFHFGFAAKRLIEDEVVVPLQRMSVYTGILVAVTGYELLQFGGCFGQVLDVESHIFDEARCSRFPRPAHGREDAGADGPVLRILFGLVGEAYGCVGLESGKALFYCTDVLPKFFRAAGFGLGQHGGQSGLVSRFYAGQGG